MASYPELLKIVEALESSTSVQAQGTINIGNVLAGSTGLRGAGYEQMLALIDKTAFEGLRKPKEEREHIRQAAAQAAAPAYEAAQAELKERAWHELSAITGTLSKIEPRIEEVQVSMNLKNLVLPNLPMAEQVPELERVIEGMRGNIFNDEQIATLRKELRGLRAEIRREKAAMRKSKAEPTDSEKEMWAVREQRLAEALVMVK
jgi:hypothetical protein